MIRNAVETKFFGGRKWEPLFGEDRVTVQVARWRPRCRGWAASGHAAYSASAWAMNFSKKGSKSSAFTFLRRLAQSRGRNTSNIVESWVDELKKVFAYWADS